MEGDHEYKIILPFIRFYMERKMLSKIGYVFNGDRLSQFSVAMLTQIGLEFSKLESEEMKKRRGRRK